MRLIVIYWNAGRMHRAMWHRRQHTKLIAKVGAYLDHVEARP